MEVETHLDTVDHDLVLRNAIAVCPSLLPSFNRLGKAYKERVRAVTAAAFNLGQFAQAENLPASLVKLRNLAKDYGKAASRFALLLWVMRVPAFTRFVFKPIRVALKELCKLEDSNNSVVDVCRSGADVAARRLPRTRPP